jgi:hypothetical protein
VILRSRADPGGAASGVNSCGRQEFRKKMKKMKNLA